MASKQDFLGKTDAELHREAQGQREALRKLRFDLGAGRVKNLRAVRATRRSIARILTVLAQRAVTP